MSRAILERRLGLTPAEYIGSRPEDKLLHLKMQIEDWSVETSGVFSRMIIKSRGGLSSTHSVIAVAPKRPFNRGKPDAGRVGTLYFLKRTTTFTFPDSQPCRACNPNGFRFTPKLFAWSYIY